MYFEIRALLSSYMVTDLGTIGGDHVIAQGINNAGEVVGGADTATGGVPRVLYTGTGMTDLGTLGGRG